jgi:hypothetical protein
VIGMYMPKPRPRATTPETVKAYVKSYGFAFPSRSTPIGARSQALPDRVPDAASRRPLLIDRRGVLRHVQEGGVYAKTHRRGRGRTTRRCARRSTLLAERDGAEVRSQAAFRAGRRSITPRRWSLTRRGRGSA